ncbi:MAG: ABC transporter permease [Thermotaleaceae bacterium]
MKHIKEFIFKLSIIGKVSFFIICFVLLIALLGENAAVHPAKIPSASALLPPSSEHWLGTDDLGIDLWGQICYGARMSVIVGVSTAVLAGLGGGLLGLISGYHGGKMDRWIMAVTDMMIALPDLPLMIVLGAFFGPSVKNIILVLSLFSWTAPARIIRSKVIALKEEKYIKAAESYGASFWYLVWYHFIPETFPLMAVSFIRLTSRAITMEASLSFLGLGDPTSKSWGLILHHAMNFKGIYFTPYWKWWVLSPLTAILLIVGAFAFMIKEIERML